jgi:hypothetical protein
MSIEYEDDEAFINPEQAVDSGLLNRAGGADNVLSRSLDQHQEEQIESGVREGSAVGNRISHQERMRLLYGDDLTQNNVTESRNQLQRIGLEMGLDPDAGMLDNVVNGIQAIGNELQNYGMTRIENGLREGMRRQHDLNNDGVIDRIELAVSKAGEDLNEQIRLLHPLIAQSHRNPNFMNRTIKRTKIKKESRKMRGDQKDLVLQGIAGYNKDTNLFNAEF